MIFSLFFPKLPFFYHLFVSVLLLFLSLFFFISLLPLSFPFFFLFLLYIFSYKCKYKLLIYILNFLIFSIIFFTYFSYFQCIFSRNSFAKIVLQCYSNTSWCFIALSVSNYLHVSKFLIFNFLIIFLSYFLSLLLNN